MVVCVLAVRRVLGLVVRLRHYKNKKMENNLKQIREQSQNRRAPRRPQILIRAQQIELHKHQKKRQQHQLEHHRAEYVL